MYAIECWWFRDYHGTFMILIILIYYFIHLQKLSGRNTNWFHVKVIINEQTMTISHYIDVCHCNVDDFEWNNVYMIYLWLMEFNWWVLQVSYPEIKHLKSSYLVYLHLEKIWCHFPKGRTSDFVAVWDRVITTFIKWIIMKMRP